MIVFYFIVSCLQDCRFLEHINGKSDYLNFRRIQVYRQSMNETRHPVAELNEQSCMSYCSQVYPSFLRSLRFT